ncbi:uncharacterized protein [Paramormyrops kingsleyae]
MPRKPQACPLCRAVYKNVSVHLRAVHKVDSNAERRLLNSLSSGRFAGPIDCPVPLCPATNLSRIDRHLKLRHSLDGDELKRLIAIAKKAAARRSLHDLRGARKQREDEMARLKRRLRRLEKEVAKLKRQSSSVPQGSGSWSRSQHSGGRQSRSEEGDMPSLSCRRRRSAPVLVTTSSSSDEVVTTAVQLSGEGPSGATCSQGESSRVQLLPLICSTEGGNDLWWKTRQSLQQGNSYGEAKTTYLPTGGTAQVEGDLGAHGTQPSCKVVVVLQQLEQEEEEEEQQQQQQLEESEFEVPSPLPKAVPFARKALVRRKITYPETLKDMLRQQFRDHWQERPIRTDTVSMLFGIISVTATDVSRMTEMEYCLFQINRVLSRSPTLLQHCKDLRLTIDNVRGLLKQMQQSSVPT